ncbi:MAG: hypothetical protein JNM80_01700 [Phycisphaerae bacterium]|nr:hypothetical protein [Phycisphaerae bacterium]
MTGVPVGRFVAISAGETVAAAIREDGTIVTWGNASTTWMAPPPGRFVRISCGATHCLAMRDTSCFANCDGSTAGPVLTVNDFICYLNRFAAADPKANCDASTVPPVLNVNDFVCFVGLYAAGCSGP